MADEEPTLPPLAPDSHFAVPPARLKRRKYSPSSLFASSSDPPVFSSDDDPALDNYLQPRRKKRYIGPWFSQQPLSSDSALGDTSPPSPAKKEKRQLKRQLDSGVWMSLDPADETDDFFELEAPASSSYLTEDQDRSHNRSQNPFTSRSTFPHVPISHLPAETSEMAAPHNEVNSRGEASTTPSITGPLSDVGPIGPLIDSETIALRLQFPSMRLAALRFQQNPSNLNRIAEIVGMCVEESHEIIDLSGFGLGSMSEAALSPLVDFITVAPNVHRDVPFEQREPKIELFLAMNQLSVAPRNLFQIEFLTVLSLRANELKEIPPAIAQLKRLRTLNLSQNLLRYLPAEMLSLILKPQGTLKTLVLHPNPFYKPIVSPKEAEKLQVKAAMDRLQVPLHGPYPLRVTEESLVWPASLKSGMLGRSYLEYTDIKGRCRSEQKFELATDNTDVRVPMTPSWKRSKQHQHQHQHQQQHQQPAATASGSSFLGPSTNVVVKLGRVRSLVELALDTAMRNAHPSEIMAQLGPEYAESHIGDYVRRATAAAEAGKQTCSVCNREMVLGPRTRWLEFRFTWLDPEPDGGEFIPFMRRGCCWACRP